MGRKGSKKKSGAVKKASSPNSSRTYLKVRAVYKCSGEKCGRTWESAHGWDPEDKINCEFCETPAEITKVVDEMLDLDNYRCHTSGCSGHWQSIRDENNSKQECDICGAMVSTDGYQKRFGRHYWFACVNKKCLPESAEWEDFSISPQRTQRCSVLGCGHRGDIIGLRKLKPLTRWEIELRKKRMGENEGREKHRAELCDMCQDVIQQGKGRSCMGLNKVHYKVQVRADGTLQEDIISVH